MEIVVQGRNVTVDPAIDADSRRKLGKLGRLASDIRRIEVEFSEVRNPRVADSQQCEVTVHLTRNLVKAHAAAPGRPHRARPRGREGRPPAEQGPRQAGAPGPSPGIRARRRPHPRPPTDGAGRRAAARCGAPAERPGFRAPRR